MIQTSSARAARLGAQIRRLLLAALFATGLSSLSCHSNRGLPPDLSAYRIVVSKSVSAWGWGGAAGFRDKDGSPVRVIFAPAPGATRYRLIMCDPSAHPCDSPRLFGDLDLSPRPIDDGMLQEFRTEIWEEDRVLMVIAERGDELLTSAPIAAMAKTRPSGYAKGGLVYDRHDQAFSWPRVPDSSLFVLTLVNQEGDATGIATRRKSWMYPELVGIVGYFHDPSRVRRLQRGQRYDVVLYAIDASHWTRLITDRSLEP